MEKKRKLSYERGKCVELPQAKLKKIFLQTKQINGSREDGRVALNAALNAFIQDVVQGTVAIAIEKSLTKEEIKKDEIDSDTEEEEEEELTNDKEDIIALDHDTVVLDMQNAHISLSNFPINEIFGFKISLKRLGLQIEETSSGVKVMDVSETKQYNIYKYVKYGDRIIMVGDEIFKFNNTNIDNVTEAFETTPRPFKLYIHRSNDNNNNTKNQNDIVTIDPTTVAVDMRNANMNSSLFPLHEIFGYEISMDKLGLKLEESPYGIRVLEYPEGKRLNIYKHLRQGDRIIMVGNMNYKFKNTTLNEVTAAFQMTPRPFKLYVHRPVKRVVYRTLPPDSTIFKSRLNMDHLREYLYSDKNKFDFLEDTFENYSSEMLLNGSGINNNNSINNNDIIEDDPNDHLLLSSKRNKRNNNNTNASVNEARSAISNTTSNARNIALNVELKSNFGNLDEVIFDGEEMDFN